MHGVGDWCGRAEPDADGDLHQQHECGYGDGELHLRRRRQPQRQQRLEEVHDRQGGLDDDGDLPGERDLRRVGADAVHGLGDRCRWVEPDARRRPTATTRMRARRRPVTRSPATRTTTAAATPKTFTIGKAASTTAVTLPGERDLQRVGADAVHGVGDRCRRPEPDPDRRPTRNNTNAGTATASYTFAGDANHNGSSDSKTFTIDKAASTTAVSCPASVTYTARRRRPARSSVTGAGGLSLTPAPIYTQQHECGHGDGELHATPATRTTRAAATRRPSRSPRRPRRRR